jgi:uncharacterized protein (TIGR00296 family)
LSDEDGLQLVKLARSAVENCVIKNMKTTVPEDIANKYNEKAGVFVTLNSFRKKVEELRGCIGFPMPEKVLYDAVVEAAISSATNDPRFKPITKEELDEIAIEISVLTNPELIRVEDPKQYKDKIKVGRDGLIVHWRYGSGLLLPQVPVEYKWDEEQFLCETCMKAGAMPDCWLYNDTKVYRFEAIVFKEVEPKGNIVRVSLSNG